MVAPLLCCLLALVTLGLAEARARDRAHRAIPIRVHVNGTRGKSTVTRLVWSALREAGIPTLAKTTGTRARLLYPDGTEGPVGRRGPANIREQLAILRLGRHLRVKAVVVECMALDPILQSVSEHDILRSTLGVITNVRHDHTEIMGDTLDEIAATLANTIPTAGVLVVGGAGDAARFRPRAAALGTRVVAAENAEPQDWSAPGWLAEDLATAHAVTRELGVADDVARRGFALAPPDPGICRADTGRLPEGTVAWVDASAANDPESLDRLIEEMPADRGGSARRRLVIYNHRADRGPRLECFATRSAVLAGATRIVVTGTRPAWLLWRRLGREHPSAQTVFVPPSRLAAYLRVHASGAVLIFCGNTRGLDVRALIEQVSRG